MVEDEQIVQDKAIVIHNVLLIAFKTFMHAEKFARCDFQSDINCLKPQSMRMQSQNIGVKRSGLTAIGCCIMTSLT